MRPEIRDKRRSGAPSLIRGHTVYYYMRCEWPRSVAGQRARLTRPSAVLIDQRDVPSLKSVLPAFRHASSGFRLMAWTGFYTGRKSSSEDRGNRLELLRPGH